MNAQFGLRSIASSLGIDSRDVLARMGGVTGQKLIAAMQPRQSDWFRIVNKAEQSTAEIFIYDEIGWYGTTAGDFADELAGVDAEEIRVHINSIGGSVFDGIAIYNSLRTHKAKVITQVDSAALSIASVIAQAGDTRRMISGSQMMIHEAWGLAIGGADDMRQYADLLDRQTDNIAAIYAERADGDKADFLTMMQGETWLNADETVTAGLADEVVRPSRQTDNEDDESDDTPGQGETEDTAARWREDFIAAAATID